MQVTHDQYTRPIVESAELRDALRSFRAAMGAEKDHTERHARGQQWQEDVTRRGRRSTFVEALDAVDARRSDPNYVNRVAIGDRPAPGNGMSCTSCTVPGPNTSVYCTVDGRRLCDYDKVGQRTAALAGNTVALSLSPQPSAGFAFWRPKMIRGHAIDATNPSIPRWEGIFLTGITVGSHPIEGFFTSPAAGVVDGIFFGDWVTPDPAGIPVGWPKFSNTSNALSLQVSGIGLWNAGVSFIAGVTVFGNPVSLEGMESRCHPQATPLPPVITSRPAGSGLM